MIESLFIIVLFLGSIFAGVFGSIVGLGGGVVIIPLLTLGFGVDIHFAIGASIVAIIATSSGAAATYVRDKMTNLRVGMFLELATTTGAIIGAGLATFANSFALELIFGSILLVSLVPTVRRVGEDLPANPELKGLAKRLSLHGSYTEPDGRVIQYNATRPREGLLGMLIAGMLSGLLGIGSGTYKVLSMDLAMKLPMKVSTTTSNFMIGVTAAASTGIFFQRGDIDPLIAAPVALGVLAGSMLGAKTLGGMSNVRLKMVFVPVIVLVALNMLARGLGWL